MSGHASVGGYELLSELGRGPRGVTFRARSPGGSEVALRLLPGETRADLRRLERERRLRGTLGEREGFVAILDAGESDEGPFLVMPLLGAGTLRDRLSGGPLPPLEGRALVRALAGAVGRAHKAGYVHLDLCPENVFFADDGRPLVADLGLGRHLGGGKPRAGSAYAAPEQRRGERCVGFEADVHALGAIACECLVGEPPLPGERTGGLLARRASAGRVAGLSPGLAFVIDRALALDPDDRFGSANALALALDIEASLREIAAVAVAITLAAVALCVLDARLFVRIAGVVFVAQLVYYTLLSIQGMVMQAESTRGGPKPRHGP